MNQLKNILTIGIFFVLLLGLSLAQLAKDSEVSQSERRKLAQKPEFNTETVLSGEYSEEIETYLLDQFPLREKFRTLQSVMDFYVWQRMDSNDIWLEEDRAFKIEYPLKEDQVAYGVKYINRLIDTHLKESEVYYAWIPDRNYFMQGGDYPTIDYNKLDEMLGEIHGKEIDIVPLLTLEDYYDTDAHWKQECIYPVAQLLAQAMGADEHFVAFEEYTHHTLEPFYGVYMGQAALPLQGDVLTYLTSAQTDGAVVTGVEFDGEKEIYTLERFEGLDGYDIYLNGAQAVLTIECADTMSDKELIIFRDSFASSITPYLVGGYKTITLVDMRYLHSSLLADVVDFHGQDVLFLYSSTMMNGAMLWK